MERRKQIEVLIGDEILAKPDLSGPRIVIGDFNEWTRGRTTKALQQSFLSHRPRPPFRFERTYPGVLPLLSLDHCYYEEPLNSSIQRYGGAGKRWSLQIICRCLQTSGLKPMRQWLDSFQTRNTVAPGIRRRKISAHRWLGLITFIAVEILCRLGR